MIIRPLLENDLDEVYDCFLAAFSDYSVPLRPGREQFEEMLRRRGYQPGISAAAFDNGPMVGFTSEALRQSGSPLRMINVDDSDQTTSAFLERIGANRTVKQFEMESCFRCPHSTTPGSLR